ncbi:uncharacterized protein EV420DRAFT_1634201 [Desarmillaria tabescens]|uniref:DUF6534 domain-containing protein n=1 Tax=Armillaria tabescens TaxID=1929756 RepID=A0AA39T7G4_ARMTA|nr:uncharacterized protein EV420DRAFT_1634201 [Desarmillaria tabescens]KAK0469781.1 hypothetical protein EV420DRAFT_1634201 [Desarmillaria tabescens]
MEAINIDDTFGAMLIGALVTMLTYGITTLQAYFYFMTYPQDSSGIKSFVALIWGLDTVHVVFMCHAIHWYLIAGFGNPAHLVEGTWSLFVSITSSSKGDVLATGQCDNKLPECDLYNLASSLNGYTGVRSLSTLTYFPAVFHRGFSVCPKPYKWWMTSVIGSMLFAHFCFGLETVGQFFVKKEFSRLNEAFFVAVLPFGITAILSDILIALGLCLLLERSRTDFANTNYLIKTLIGYAITRCLLTSLVAVVEVIVFVTKPTSFYSFAIDFVIGKLWSNSLLASLNSRRALRDTFNRKDSRSTSTSFRIGSPGFGTTDAEPGQISLVRVSDVSYTNFLDFLTVFRRYRGKAKAKAPVKKAVHALKSARKQADSLLKFGLAWLTLNEHSDDYSDGSNYILYIGDYLISFNFIQDIPILKEGAR